MVSVPQGPNGLRALVKSTHSIVFDRAILDAEINKNKELTTVADKLKEDLEILNQRNQEIANKLERNIKENQVAEKREVQLEKSWLYKLFN